MKVVNPVSSCCRASIVEGSETEYPLGGRTYGMRYKVDVCENCGKEVEETLEECGICGEVGCLNQCEEVSK